MMNRREFVKLIGGVTAGIVGAADITPARVLAVDMAPKGARLFCGFTQHRGKPGGGFEVVSTEEIKAGELDPFRQFHHFDNCHRRLTITKVDQTGKTITVEHIQA